MRAIVCEVLIASVVGAVLVGCGEVRAKSDAGAVGGDDAPMQDADTSGCAANSYSCGNDDALYQCDADGVALTKVQDCQYGCSVDHCNECAANSMFCSGAELATCDADGNIVNPQTCEHGCQMDRCNTCDPGVAYCDGANGNAVMCGLDGEPGTSMACDAAGCQGGVCNTCTPSTTSCKGDKLVVCNASGAVQSTTDCALGCGTSPNAHCKALVPSYGVPAPSGTLPNLVVNADATLDISNCSGSPSSVDLTINGTTMSIVGSPQVLLKTQPSNNPPICIVRFGTITIDADKSLTVTNSATVGHALSLQAVGDVNINGTLSFTNAADGLLAGQTVLVVGTNSNNKYMAAGAGGAGAARGGGAGGICMSCGSSGNAPGGTGGAADTTSTMILRGGSAGGSVMSGGTVYGKGGRGGGGLQIVSLTRVTMSATGRVILNGGGGLGPYTGAGWLLAGGGGSGGTLVVEAPALSLSAGAISVANGGGGAGACVKDTGGALKKHMNGEPGQLSDTRAVGGDCLVAGDGGFEANGDTTPSINGSSSDAACGEACGGAGGGSSGFIYLRGRSTTYVMIAGGAVVSPQPTIGAVTAN